MENGKAIWTELKTINIKLLEISTDITSTNEKLNGHLTWHKAVDKKKLIIFSVVVSCVTTFLTAISVTILHKILGG